MKTLIFPLPTDTSDFRYASGSFHSIYKSLSKLFNIIPVGPLKLKKNQLHSAFNRLNDYNIFPWRFATMHSWQTVDSYGKQIQKLINDLEFDAIFSTSTLHAAAVKTSKPMFAYTDFSYSNALEYYPFASSLYPASKREALAVDRFCFEKHTKIFLASEWAKNRTVEAYKLSPEKIIVVGRGANLISDYNNDQIKAVIDKRINSNIKNFLFVGVDWERKGGEKVYEIVKKINQIGINAKLQIVGCNPPEYVRNSGLVESYGYLNRNTHNELENLKKLFTDAWIFIMLTKAEAMGIVFNEASSFGLPSIAYNTGGVGAAIENNVTGKLFDLKDTIDKIILEIVNLFNDPLKYKTLSFNAFNKYQTTNNWDSIALRIKEEIGKILR